VTRTRRRRSRHARWSCPCFDCEVEGIPATGEQEYYSVRDEIWAAAWRASSSQQLILFDVDMDEPADGVYRHGTFLCIGCLEQRIGRRLAHDDFSDAPINALHDDAWSLHTSRLHDRMSS
jgi:hypothetical protein